MVVERKHLTRDELLSELRNCRELLTRSQNFIENNLEHHHHQAKHGKLLLQQIDTEKHSLDLILAP